MSYRAPPAVLPSLRDFPAEVKAISDGINPIERSFLASRGEDSIAREHPALAAALDDAVRARMAEIRAAAAPCPAPWSPRLARSPFEGGGSNEKTLALIRHLRDLWA